MVSLNPPPRVPPIGPPASSDKGASRESTTPLSKGLLAGGALLALGLIGFSLFVVLPRWADARKDIPSEPLPPATHANPASSPAPVDDDGSSLQELREQAHRKLQAEQAAQRATDLLETLESRSVSLWGDDSLPGALEHIESGRASMAAGDFPGAEASFQRAHSLLESIEAGSVEVLQNLLTEGEENLDTGNATAAGVAFSLALSISPGDPTVSRGLARSETLDELAGLLESGRRSERTGDLTTAESIYRQAVALDPYSSQARESLVRVQSRITDDAFTRAMSEALTALDRSDDKAAIDAFRRADAIKPGSPQVTEGITQAEDHLKLEQITALRDTALAKEQAEEWTAAAEDYASVLELDPAVRFSQTGEDRCLKRADLAAQLQFHLDHEDRLSADDVLLEASDLLAEAETVTPAGPRHQKQIDDLKEIVARMSPSVSVTLESDNRTEVTIYKVGRLGRFLQHRLDLRPGTYTVVGSRKGYRDVRRELVVRPDTEPGPLMIRCKEKT